MFKRELKINFKSFLTWISVLLIMFLMVFLIYPSILSGENMEMMEDLIKVFPKELLAAFNMDLSGINTIFGWIKSEGFIMIILLGGIYSSLLGSTILLKEENDKTIEYLNSLPVTRQKIVLSKITVGFIYIILFVLIIGLTNFIGLSLTEEFDKKVLLYLSIAPLLSFIVIFSLSLFISTFFQKTKKVFGISIGIVFLSYFIQIFSNLSEKLEFLKYICVYTLSDARAIISTGSFNPYLILISVSVTAVFIFLTFLRYSKKELV